ncbi:MAG TPA: N-acetyltransferase [Micromonosporaceae bacterium]
MTVTFTTAAERPDLADAMWAMPSSWPEFMFHDAVANLFFPRLVDTFGAYQLIAVDDSGAVVGRVNSVPFAWSGSDDDLPERGWDGILERAFTEHALGVAPTAASLLEARLTPERQGVGLSSALLAAAGANAQRRGLADLFGPVRPTDKSSEPRTPMADYLARTREDSLPADPWLRVHVRAGGRVVRICPTSMTIVGTLTQWRDWTGLPLDRSGLVDVAGALTPLHVSVEHDHAVYVEPNVWMHHRLTDAVPGRG